MALQRRRTHDDARTNITADRRGVCDRRQRHCLTVLKPERQAKEELDKYELDKQEDENAV